MNPLPQRYDLPHSARVYDYWLDGKDNFTPDRVMADKIRELVPAVPEMVKANRKWMLRVAATLVGEYGIRQFLDIGTGIPTHPNLHEVAQELAPETRVVYVDNDPMVMVHARALLNSSPEGVCAYLDTDIRDTQRVLSSTEVTRTLDLSKPIAVTMASILMLLNDKDDPWDIVAGLLHRMPAGSFVAISHPTADFDPTSMAKVVSTTAMGGLTFVPRTYNAVEQLFCGWELIEPGLVPILSWRPDDPPENPQAAYYYAGVARKPR